jgi:hypothetical protein
MPIAEGCGQFEERLARIDLMTREDRSQFESYSP